MAFPTVRPDNSLQDYPAFVADVLINASATVTRPANTTAYASGDLVANSATAGSVTPLSWTASREAGVPFRIQRVRMKMSDAVLTNASFRLHLYGSAPTVTNGDNGAWVSIDADYLGSIDITVDKAFSVGSAGVAVPTSGVPLGVVLASGTTLYGLLEARAVYTPTSAEVFTVVLEISQN